MSDDVKRYDLRDVGRGHQSDWRLMEDNEGELVYYEDVRRTLAARLADAEAEVARLREDAARLAGVLVTYHHAFVTDNKPPVAAQMVAREYARKQRAALAARAQEARDDA